MGKDSKRPKDLSRLLGAGGRAVTSVGSRCRKKRKRALRSKFMGEGITPRYRQLKQAHCVELGVRKVRCRQQQTIALRSKTRQVRVRTWIWSFDGKHFCMHIFGSMMKSPER